MQFNYGFEYKNVKYGWNQKQLYRLPFYNSKRTYQLKLIKPIVIGSTTCYNIQRNKITINRLKTLTEKVNWVVDYPTENICPF